MNAGKRCYLTIDGVDGTGKTVVCKEFQNITTDWEVLTSPSYPFNHRWLREQIDQRRDLALRAWYYRMAVQMDALKINKYKEENTKNIITDRSPLSTWICTWMEVDGLKDHEELFWLDLPEPDLRIVLTASKEVRKKRLQERRRQSIQFPRLVRIQQHPAPERQELQPSEEPRKYSTQIEDDVPRQENWQKLMTEWGENNDAEVINTDKCTAKGIAKEIVERMKVRGICV